MRLGDVEQGLAEADVVIEREYRTPTYDHMFLEPECSIGVPAGYDDEHTKLTVYVGSQIPYADRAQIAAALDLPEEEVRVIGTPIGGAFGGKEDIMGQIHAALLAQATGRPVKILYDRAESLLAHPKRHATVIRINTGAKRDGTLTAVRAELVGDAGAYASLSTKVLERATTHASGPYQVPHVQDRLLCHVHQQPARRRLSRLWRHPVRLCRREQHGPPGPRNWAWTPLSCGASTPSASAPPPPPARSCARAPACWTAWTGSRSRVQAVAQPESRDPRVTKWSPGASRPPTRTPASAAAPTTPRAPRSRSIPTAQPRSAAARPTWARA